MHYKSKHNVYSFQPYKIVNLHKTNHMPLIYLSIKTPSVISIVNELCQRKEMAPNNRGLLVIIGDEFKLKKIVLSVKEYVGCNESQGNSGPIAEEKDKPTGRVLHLMVEPKEQA
jgi:hypothetical protein